jgi:hypothetical protein
MVTSFVMTDPGRVNGSSKLSVDELRERFAQWRSTRAKKARIPDELWAAAVEVARRDGVNRTAQVLHLDGGKLMCRFVAAGATDRSAGESAPPAFIELIPTQPEARLECVLEAESAQAGKVRIELKAVTVREVAELSRTLLGL